MRRVGGGREGVGCMGMLICLSSGARIGGCHGLDGVSERGGGGRGKGKGGGVAGEAWGGLHRGWFE